MNNINNFRPGLYEHYISTPNSRRYYQVLGISRNTETEELYALYIPLYVIDEHKGARFQCRPLDMFLDEVEYKGTKQPRFKYVGQVLE